MSAAPLESQGWARGRWLAIIGLVLAAQLVMIFWLARHGAGPPPLARAPAAPRIYLPANSKSDLGASDPTMGVRANQRGFSGPAWMQPPALPYDLPKWTDSSPPSNELRVQQLGGILDQFLQTNSAAVIELTARQEPELPVIASDDTPIAEQSALILEGGLAARPLRHPLKLAEWPATETAAILSNSVVRAGVDENGDVFSAVLVAGSGSKDADASALALARRARFESRHTHGATEPGAQTWGEFVFHWHTLPAAPATNNPPVKP